jgi:hypothetical protein
MSAFCAGTVDNDNGSPRVSHRDLEAERAAVDFFGRNETQRRARAGQAGLFAIAGAGIGIGCLVQGLTVLGGAVTVICLALLVLAVGKFVR